MTRSGAVSYATCAASRAALLSGGWLGVEFTIAYNICILLTFFCVFHHMA